MSPARPGPRPAQTRRPGSNARKRTRPGDATGASSRARSKPGTAKPTSARTAAQGRKGGRGNSQRSGATQVGHKRASGPRTGPRTASSAGRGLGGTQVEGRQAVRELLLAGRRRVTEVLVTEQQDDHPRQAAHDALQDIVDIAVDLNVPVREVSRARLRREARTDAPQGVIAHAEPLPEHLVEDLLAREAGNPFLVAVDGVTDPGNLGSLIRSAECAGVTGFVLPRHRAVHVTPAVTKASAGAVEYMPMAVVGGLPTAISRLRSAGIWVVGLDAAGEQALFDIAIDARLGICLVLGAEGKGLSRLSRQRCDLVANLPLLGHLSSLNVATAGAVACYEVARRRAAGPG